jgi:antitoxin MazE
MKRKNFNAKARSRKGLKRLILEGLDNGAGKRMTTARINTIYKKSAKTQKYSLKKLLSGVTPQNRHPETDWGRPIGEEIW